MNIDVLRERGEAMHQELGLEQYLTGAGLKESHVHDVTITKEAPNYRSQN